MTDNSREIIKAFGESGLVLSLRPIERYHVTGKKVRVEGEQEKCERCRGRGWERVLPPNIGDQTCPDCKGTGEKGAGE